MRIVVVVCGFVAACTSSNATVCSDGALCPAGTACVFVPLEEELLVDEAVVRVCVDPQQQADCAGHPNGDPCMVRGVAATCHDQVCLPDRCGNGLRDSLEACDDGDTQSGDGCSADCQSAETCGNMIRDAITGEQCDLGDQLAHDGCSSTCQLEAPQWDAIVNVMPRASTALAYDAHRHRVVMFSGGPTTNAISTFDDTQEWNGKRWTRATAAIAPTPRVRHAMAYDAKREQIVMFGGNTQQRDTWTYDTGGWTLHTPATVPTALSQPAMVYDAAHERIVMFGGTNGTVVTNTTYVWNGSDWSELVTSTPPPVRAAHAMAYDARRHVVVLFGGNGQIGPLLNDGVWELDGSTWTQKLPASGPLVRAFHALAYDPSTQQVMMVGGRDGNNVVQSDAWLWDGTRWTATTSPVASPIEYHAMTTDTERGRVEVLDVDGSLYEWDGASWTLAVKTAATTPSARVDAAGALDPLQQQLVLFGGSIETAGPPNLQGDTWTWTGSWFPASTPAALTARRAARMVFDPVRREIVLFGGCDAVTRYDETWVWTHTSPSDRGHWVQRMPAAKPPGRCRHAMAWDDVRGRVIVFGGDVGVASPTEQWSWDGTTWQLDAVASPPEREDSAVASDPLHHTIVVFGGYRRSTGFNPLDDTWIWNGQSWTADTGVTHPSVRYRSALAWDPARSELVLFGGEGGGASLGSVFTWDGTTWTLVPTIAAPSNRGPAISASSPDGAGIVIFGGRKDLDLFPATMLGDMLRLRWSSFGEIDETCTANDIDGDGKTGCEDPDCWRVCTPSCVPGVMPCPPGPHCGDGTCDVLEAHDFCPSDCP